MQPVDPANLPALPSIVGTDRFTPYLLAEGNDQDRAARLYAWNVEASAGLLGAFAALEVGLRNAMHDSLTGMFQRSDWWHSAPLSVSDRDEAVDAEDYVNRRKGSGNWGSGHVVAELKTSFWEGLLVNKYHASLWEKGLSGAFPHYQGRRDGLRGRMERLRLLRNRAAHHEPIFARDLNVDHRYMCELAGFVASDLQTLVASHSRLPGIVAARPQTVAGTRPTRF